MVNCRPYSSLTYNSCFSADLMTACDNLKEWADTWQLQIALEKCFVHRVTNQYVHIDIEQIANLKSP